MFGYFRIACCVPKVSVGDTLSNVAAIADMMRRCAEKKADICVFPELCVTGYTCQDLFFQSSLIENSRRAVATLALESRRYDMTVVVGVPLKVGSELFNCAAVISNGAVCGVYVKSYLPNYNEYYEKRWFSSARELTVDFLNEDYFDLPEDLRRRVPIGADLVFEGKEGVRFAAEICEDLWTALPPSTYSSLCGAQIILNLSASNETISKRSYRRSLVVQQSARCVCAYAYASAGEDESTQDLIYSGHSLIAENGSLIKENADYIDSDYILIGDVDVQKLVSDRLKNKSFSDCAALNARQVRIVPVKAKTDKALSDGALAQILKTPFVPSDNRHRLERCTEIFKMQTAALKKRLRITGAKAVIGVSGGLDSTLALLVTANAMREMGRDMSDVIAITMPCFGTTDRTHSNAWKLMETLGVDAREINIKDACTLHCADIGHDISKLDVTFENVQARERTQVLMDVACREGGFVIGTGDLSELALGWCTYNADHMSMYSVNCSVPKTLIRWMISSIADQESFAACRDTLIDIIDTPISPELLPPDENGKIAQQTESLIGPYILHDFFLYYVLRFGFSPDKIFFLAKRAFDGETDGETIKKWLKVFYRRFFSQQFKRSCLPDGVKIGSVCLSPRGDWRMPSDASASDWLKAVESL